MQIVGYETGVRDLTYDPERGIDGDVSPPALLIADDGVVTRHALEPRTELSYGLGDRHCAGAIDGERHAPCDSAVAPYCDEHTSAWPCARCTGNCGLPIDACREEHAVYLAAFAPATFKVGVTRLWRLPARLLEQGADRAAHIHTVSDGRIARRIESEIAETLPDRVPVDAKVAALDRSVETAAWEALLDTYAVLETFTFDDDLDLDARPVVDTIAAGTVIGTRGRLLVLRRDGGTYAVDLRDLVGYELRPGAPGRDLQSNLGAFR